MSPERAVNSAKSGILSNIRRVSLIAIDEAHCVSEWGHDFRAEYGELSMVIEALATGGRQHRPPPVIALTATCKAAIREDVVKSLQLQGAEHIVGSMNRPNLHFAVEEVPDKQRMERRMLQLFDAQEPHGSPGMLERQARPIDNSSPGPCSSTVIYCRRKQDCEDLAELLTRGGVHADAFHSGLSNKKRLEAQRAFSKNEIQVVAATVAFGMGIDKPDVRRVLHFGMPKSLEAYMQESGRASRDGCAGSCLVFFLKAERMQSEQAMFCKDPQLTPALYRSVIRVQTAFHYCRNRHRCRRAQLLEYLGEEPCTAAAFANICTSQQAPAVGSPGFCAFVGSSSSSGSALRCGRCDNCDTAMPLSCLSDTCKELLLLFRHLSRASGEGRVGRGALSKELRSANMSCGRTQDQWQRILDAAVFEGLVRLDIVQTGRSAFVAHAISEEGRRRLESMESDAAANPRQRSVPFLVDLGVRPAVAPIIAALSERRSLSASLASVEDPASPDVHIIDCCDSEDQDEVPGRKRSLEAEVVSAQPTPQRQKRRMSASTSSSAPLHEEDQDASVLSQEFAKEVDAVRQLVATRASESRTVGLSQALADLRQLRAKLAASEAPVEAGAENPVAQPAEAVEARSESPGMLSVESPISVRRKPPTLQRAVSGGGHQVPEAPQPGGQRKIIKARGPKPRRQQQAQPEHGQTQELEEQPPLRGDQQQGQQPEHRPQPPPEAVREPKPPEHRPRPPPARQDKQQPARPAAKAKAEAKAEAKAAAAPEGNGGRRTKRYGEAERAAASALLRKTMECADYNSNQTGGSDGFKRLIEQAKRLAPPDKRRLLDEVLSKHYKANTPGRHGKRLDVLIAEWKAEPG